MWRPDYRLDRCLFFVFTVLACAAWRALSWAWASLAAAGSMGLAIFFVVRVRYRTVSVLASSAGDFANFAQVARGTRKGKDGGHGRLGRLIGIEE